MYSFPCHREATASPLQMFSFWSQATNPVSLLPLTNLYWASLTCAASACCPGPSPGSTDSNCARALFSPQLVVLGRGRWLGGTGISYFSLMSLHPSYLLVMGLGFRFPLVSMTEPTTPVKAKEVPKKKKKKPYGKKSE